MYEQNNNYAEVAGIISAPPEYSHEVLGEKFYKITLSIQRISGNVDNLNLLISERIMNADKMKLDMNVMVHGQFRSYNDISNGINRLLLTVFVKDVTLLEGDSVTYVNNIVLKGFTCKPVCYRKTPFGREISDVLLAVNRQFNKSDYIPCILWGRNANYAKDLEIGSNLTLYGRIQSREYIKVTDSGDEKRTAYEVSVSRLEVKNENAMEN